MLSSHVGQWIRQSAAPLKGVTAGIGFEDLEPFRRWIGNARIVGLGEATHSTREFFQLKHRLLEFLVAELGFTIFTIEANFSDTLAINRYVLTGEGDPAHSLASLRIWCWDCDEVLEMIEWIRDWNAQQNPKIRFYGFDSRSSSAAAILLLDYLERHDTAAYQRFRSALFPLATEEDGMVWVARSDSEREAIRKALGELAAELTARPVATSDERYDLGLARLHAEVIAQCDRQWAGAASRLGHERDRAMADNLTALLELHGPDSKAVVWAHNGHIQLQAADALSQTWPPMGQYLRQRFGNQYVALGFAFDHGAFGALDEANQMRDCHVESVAGSLDATFAEVGPPLFAIDLRSVPRGAEQWLAAAPASRHIGGAYYPRKDSYFWSRADVRRLFDALIFVRETSAAHRRPTASSMFEMVREDPPVPTFVNLDFQSDTEGWRTPVQPSVGAYHVAVVHEPGRRFLEISRSEAYWPWDRFRVSQTVLAEAWRNKRISIRCPLSMQPAHHGSSAQLAVWVVKRTAPPEDFALLSDWYQRFAWQRTIAKNEEVRELCVTTWVEESADSIVLALIMTGDGRLRLGPVTIESAN